MDVDELVRRLSILRTEFLRTRRVFPADAVDDAMVFVATARHLKVTPEGGDRELIEQLSRAARVCDSSLMEVAALRLENLVRRIEELERGF
jgi:hypothetical protein